MSEACSTIPDVTKRIWKPRKRSTLTITIRPEPRQIIENYVARLSAREMRTVSISEFLTKAGVERALGYITLPQELSRRLSERAATERTDAIGLIERLLEGFEK